MQQKVFVTFALTTLGTCFSEVHNVGNVTQIVNIEENSENIISNTKYIKSYIWKSHVLVTLIK